MASGARNTVLLLVLVGVVLQLSSVMPTAVAGRMLANEVAGGAGHMNDEVTGGGRRQLIHAGVSMDLPVWRRWHVDTDVDILPRRDP